jgi:alcohol dehydrogenase (cytochrome c)
MNIRLLTISLLLPLFPSVLPAQGLNPQKLLQPPTDTWPTYNGDYSGRRYSSLSQIHSSTVGSLSLAWMHRIGVGEL